MNSRAKKFLILGLALCFVMAGGVFGAYKGYKSVRQTRLVKKAKGYIAKDKDRNALLCLQRALSYNGNDLEALRLMASLCEKMRIPSALVLRDRVVDLNPDSTDDRLALAQTALVFRDLQAATNALAGIKNEGIETAPFHNLAGAVAASIRDLVAAETHFSAAVRLEPDNPAPKMNLAVVQLQSTNAEAQAQARASLEGLSANTTNAQLRCQALRELGKDAARRSPVAALVFFERLLRDTNSVFTDRITRLSLMRASTNSALAEGVSECRTIAASSPAHIYELATWHFSNIPHAETLAWLQSLPADAQTNQPTAWLIANCHALVGNWAAAHRSLETQKWAEMEFLRHAFMSRALEGQNLGGASKGEWELALRAAGEQKGSLRMLFQLAAQWRRQSEAEELLWQILNRYPDERWVPQTLMNALYAGGRTRSLLQLFTIQAKRQPTSLPIKNNLAMMALLLEANELNPHELAQQTYESASTNAEYASTYAFSLHQRQKTAEALSVMEKLVPQQLSQPGIAAYYGILLKASGAAEKARAFLEVGNKAVLLPEERKLLEQARLGT